jgi:hypothetical protein
LIKKKERRKRSSTYQVSEDEKKEFALPTKKTFQ